MANVDNVFFSMLFWWCLNRTGDGGGTTPALLYTASRFQCLCCPRNQMTGVAAPAVSKGEIAQGIKLEHFLKLVFRICRKEEASNFALNLCLSSLYKSSLI